MSEETHNAAALGPLAIQWAVIVSGILGWILTISMCFCLTDYEGILNTPTGLPAAQIFLNAGGKLGGSAMWGLAILVQFFTGCSAMLADTRMAYAFARDEALPFSSYAPYHPSSDKQIQLTAQTTQLPLPNKPIHPNPRQRRLVRRLLQHLPELHCHRLDPHRHRDLQHHRAGIRSLLRVCDSSASDIPKAGQVHRGAVYVGKMGTVHQLGIGNMGYVYQLGAVLSADGAGDGVEYVRSYPLIEYPDEAD